MSQKTVTRELRALLHEKVELVKIVKKEQRTPHQPNWTWSRQYLLFELKRDLSVICAALAQRRGRQHIKRFPCVIGSTELGNQEALDKLVTNLEEKFAEKAA